MKLSDLNVILNGIEMVTKSFIRMKEKELVKNWKNSSFSTVSKSVATSAEETLSSLIASSNGKNPLIYLTNEMKGRSSMISESMKQYAAHIINQEKYKRKTNDFDIEHPVMQQMEGQISFLPSHEVTSSTEILQKSQLVSKQTNNVLDSMYQIPEIQHASEKSEIEYMATGKDQLMDKCVEINGQQKLAKSHRMQKLSEKARATKVPSSRISRLISYGGLAAGLSLGTVAEVVRRNLGLKSDVDSSTQPLLSENPFLNEANAKRIVDTLCKVRGAALKLGQMLSIQDNAMINPQLAAIFERVRQSADFMPSWQMEKVLKKELGHEWRNMFAEFDSKPFAAASIGQVHCAKLHDGTDVALKIQYPGVAEGIESDIKSLLGIVHFWNILPKGLYVENAMSVAQRELSKEVDYLLEAQSGKRFKKLLEPYPYFYVPKIFDNLCTSNVLTTELVYGTPIDTLKNSSQELRNEVCEKLMHLCLMEIFLFRFMQTDPNWSNFLYNFDTKQIVLLDFGACNEYTFQFVNTYMKIIKAAADQDRVNVLRFSKDLGFLTGYETKVLEEAHTDAVMILGEAFASKEPFSFTQQNMTHRIHDLVPIMLKHRLTPPPEESYSLHRKMSGIFLLCTKLDAIVDCRKLFNTVYEEYCKRNR